MVEQRFEERPAADLIVMAQIALCGCRDMIRWLALSDAVIVTAIAGGGSSDEYAANVASLANQGGVDAL